MTLEQMREALLKALAWLRGAQPPMPPATPPEIPQDPPAIVQEVHLDSLMFWMREFEGKPGDLNYKNNNPLNCRCSSVGYMPVYGNVKCVNNFAVFPNYELGWLYAKNLLKQKIAKHPTWTLTDLISDEHDGWAPPSDYNPSTRYVQFLAKYLQVDVSYPIKNLII